MRIIYRVGYWLENDSFIEQAIHVVAGYPRPTHPAMIDEDWFGNSKAQVVEYLESGHELLAYMGYSWCRFKCGIDDSMMGCRDLTDGTWCWPEGLSHYIEHHNLILPEAFVEHMRLNHFQVGERPLWLDLASDQFFKECRFDDSIWKDWYHRRISS